METRTSTRAADVRLKRPTRLLVVGATVAILAAAISQTRHIAGSDNRLVIDPQLVSLTDTPHKDGETVRGIYRLTNRSSKPVLIKSYTASCACSASEPETGQTPPFVLMPGRSTGFVIRTVLTATHEPTRKFHATVESECDGKPLPAVVATMEVRIEDVLLPYPRRVNAANIPPGKPARYEILLATQRKLTPCSRPTVIPSDPSWIQAALFESDPSNLPPSELQTRYRLQITLTPRNGAIARSGSLTLRFDDRPSIEIPVECSIKVPYRLSADVITLRARPGEEAAAKVFYEFFEPDLGKPRVMSAPAGVRSTIEEFDRMTRLIRVSARLPNQSAGPRPSGEITLNLSDDTPAVRIPIVCEVVEP